MGVHSFTSTPFHTGMIRYLGDEVSKKKYLGDDTPDLVVHFRDFSCVLHVEASS
jgi:hypothetical protein